MAKRPSRLAAARAKADAPPRPKATAALPAGGDATATAAAPPPPAASSEALEEFEVAMTALQRHDYQKARTSFRRLLDSFPSERALLERVRVFLDLCERELRHTVAAPSTIEERLTLATAALNDGDDGTAERLAQEVLGVSPDHDLALYIVAAVRSRGGDPEAALEYLRHAVEVSPDISAQARHDTDFLALREVPEFRALLDPPGANGDHRRVIRQAPRRSDR